MSVALLTLVTAFALVFSCGLLGVLGNLMALAALGGAWYVLLVYYLPMERIAARRHSSLTARLEHRRRIAFLASSEPLPSALAPATSAAAAATDASAAASPHSSSASDLR
jgi:hypothetical protein